MKNLILILTLSFLMSSFSLREKPTEGDIEAIACVDVTLSCGISGPVCGATTADLIRNILWAENYFCGGGQEQ